MDGYLLAGRYRLADRLGEGGAGTVWRARDETLQRDVAVKQVRVPRELGPAERARFAEQAMYEARSAGRLRDPAIVLVHDVVLEHGRPWIVMDLAPGRSLDQVIKRDGPLPPRQVARIGAQILSALEVAHANGILHQDVKPGNILLEADGRAMLTDFGIAMPIDAVGTAGSPGYMAPERLNELPSGPSSDLWSLAASLYTAVEGRSAFARELPDAVTAAVLLHDPPPPARAGRELGELLLAMLAKDPRRRPPVEEVRARLARLAASPAGARRRWVLAAGLAAVVVAGALWYGFAVPQGADPATAGRFAAVPEPCGLVGEERARALLGGAVRKVTPRAGQCRWELVGGTRAKRSLTITLRAERPQADHSAPAVAALLFRNSRDDRAAGKGTTFRTTTWAVRDVPRVGEEAFAQDQFTTLLSTKPTKPPEGRAVCLVVFRWSNLIGEVAYTTEEVTAPTPAARAAAAGAAGLVSKALAG